MDMVFIVIYYFESYQRVMLRNLRQLLVHIGNNSLIEYLFPVFRYQNYMIIALIDTMRKMNQFHASYYIPKKKMQGELHPSTLRSGN